MNGPFYTEERPPADLVPWVASFWRIRGDLAHGRSVVHRILPDGCADIIFDLQLARASAGSSGDLVVPASAAMVVTLEGRIDYLGIRFRPGVVGTLTGIPADRLQNSPLSDADPSFPLAVSAAHLASVPVGAQLALLIAACRRRIAVLDHPDRVVQWAIETWHRSAEGPYRRVSAMARDVALSERAFERRFVREVGLTPVEFRRVARFRAVLRRHGAGNRDWAALAAAQGFSDQSHLAREFRHFSGLAPSAWARGANADAGFLQDSRVTTF